VALKTEDAMRKLSFLGFAFCLPVLHRAEAGLHETRGRSADGLARRAGRRVQARDARWWKVYGDPVLDR